MTSLLVVLGCIIWGGGCFAVGWCALLHAQAKRLRAWEIETDEQIAQARARRARREWRRKCGR